MGSSAKAEKQEEMGLAKAAPMALAIPTEQFIADAGAGLEEVGSDDMAVPYLSILQKQSKVFDNPGFSGKPGQFMHTITKELFDGQKGVDVIPCHFRRFWREITQDLKNPKFVAEHPSTWPKAKGATFDAAGRRHICHDGTHANQIMRFYGLVVAPCEDPQPVCLTFKGSQIKAAKAWNSMLSVATMDVPTAEGVRRVAAPTYLSIWNLSTSLNTNDDGSWYAYEVTSKGKLDPFTIQREAELYQQARAFHDMVAGGRVEEVGEEDI